MKNLTAVVGVALVFVYIIGSGLWVNTGDNWYRTLNQPAWQPPDFIFGIIWPYNFMVLGIASYQVSLTLTKFENILWLVFFGLSVAAALTWAYQFYVPHNLTLAPIALTLCALLTLPVLYLTFKASILMGLLLVPYQIWVAIAASLAWGYSTRN